MSRQKKAETHQRKARRPSVPAQPRRNQWAEMIRHYIHHPVDFVKDQLNVTPDDWQGDVLNALATNDRVAVRSGHGVGKCNSANSDILLADGSYVRVGDLVGRSAKVLAWYPDGRIAPARAFFTDNGVKPVWRVRTRLGRAIDRTGNHPFLTIDGWKQVRDLQVGDSLAMPTTIPVEGTQPMNEDELKVLAYLIGDGSLTGNSTPSFSKRESPQLREFESSCLNLGCVLKPEGDSFSSFRVVRDKDNPVMGYANPVIELLREHGLLGKNAHEKFVPDSVFRVPNDQVSLFLSRLFATDGWAHVNKKTGRIEVGYSSVSRKLIEDVQRLALRLGIVGRVRRKTTCWTYNGVKKRSIAWCWQIHNADMVLAFADRVGIFGKERTLAECVRLARRRIGGQHYTQGYRTWPESALDKILDAAKRQGVPFAMLRDEYGVRKRCRKIRMSSEKVKQAIELVDLPELKVLADADIGWDVVESVEYLGEQPTVAITVPGPETFVVDVIEHNTATEVFVKYWFLFTRPHARVPCTAPGRPQLEDVLWPESAKWLQSSNIAPFFRWTKTKVYFVGHEETWFATMRTAAKPENMQGFHGDHMLWILDEASGLEDEITEVIEGSLTGGRDNKILMCGNPTQLSGLFHRAFHREADLWHTFKVSCIDSPRVSRSYIEKMRRFGEDHDIYRVRVLGEFPKGGMDTFLPYGEVEKATNRVVPEGTPVEMGLDVARFGDDYTVFAIRKGMKLLPLEVRGGWDTVRTADFAAELVREHGVTRIKVDDTGVGGGVTDNLRRLKREKKLPRHVEIVPVNNGSKGDEYYDNTGALSWGQFKELLPFISLPREDEQLFAELTDRRKKMTPKGKIALEPKSEMKARGKPSPDRADAAVLAFYEADIPEMDPESIGRAFSFATRNFWAPSRWKLVG